MAQEQKENVTAATAAEDLQEVQADTEAPEEPKRPLTAKEKRAARAAAARQEAESEAENKAKARKGALFLGAVVVIYIIYLIISGQMASFIEALSNVELNWILGAAFCYVMYFVFGVIAYAIAVYLDHDSPVGIADLMSVEASGVFFGNLTPMMAGAVPSQIVRLTRTGLDVGEASATQFTRFIMFQLAVVIFAALMLVAKLSFFFETYGDIVFLNLVVFGVHLVECIALFVICLCPKLVMRVGNWAIEFLSKRGWLKNREKWDETVNVQVMEFSNAFKRRIVEVLGVEFPDDPVLIGFEITDQDVVTNFGVEAKWKSRQTTLMLGQCKNSTDDDMTVKIITSIINSAYAKEMPESN